MRRCTRFYMDGAWVEPSAFLSRDIVNPATEQIVGQAALGSGADINRAVAAARTAFPAFARSSVPERLDLLDRIIAEYQRRSDDLAVAITLEMGAPAWLATQAQVPLGKRHFQTARDSLADYAFESAQGPTRLVKEPIGVCGLITPWNWPLNQIACKMAPALAVGCTMVLKPAETAPFSAQILAEIIDQAGVPAGVFNLVHGDGPGAGAALCAHPDVDLISFTGSTRAGIEVARTAAPTVKRVLQELGGKSPNILLDSADFEAAVVAGVSAVTRNSGQSCLAPTRMLVPRRRRDQVVALARSAAEATRVGDPLGANAMGPVSSAAQWRKVQALIGTGLDEGARLVAGGLGRPPGLERGYYVRPTVFADVTAEMTIAREEIFGPVLCIQTYESEDEAVSLANNTDYGLCAYVQGELTQARQIAARLRAGQVVLNGAPFDFTAPFGGYKHSGNGREWGPLAFQEYVEMKAIVGFD